jgi:hypothetical protein
LKRQCQEARQPDIAKQHRIERREIDVRSAAAQGRHRRIAAALDRRSDRESRMRAFECRLRSRELVCGGLERWRRTSASCEIGAGRRWGCRCCSGVRRGVDALLRGDRCITCGRRSHRLRRIGDCGQ